MEAIQSVTTSASPVRTIAEQAVSTQAQTAAATVSAPEVPQAPYVSPYIHLDLNYNKVVLQIRDSNTGDVVQQYPSQPSLRAQIATQQAEASAARSDALSQQAKQQVQHQQKQTVQVQQQAAPQPAPTPTPQQQQTPQVSTASFGAFAKQVASLQTAVSGGSHGGTVSLFA